MFEFDVRFCCGWICKVGVCFRFVGFVDDWCLNVMSDHVVIGCVKLVCVFVLLLVLMIVVCMWCSAML